MLIEFESKFAFQPAENTLGLSYIGACREGKEVFQLDLNKKCENVVIEFIPKDFSSYS